jgi:hypothetical protein
MLVKLVGMNRLDFAARDGNRVQGTNLFIAFPFEGVTGQKTERIFVKNEIHVPDGIKPGDTLELMFNMNGKAESVAIATGKA